MSALGNALGIGDTRDCRPERAKEFVQCKSFALSGRWFVGPLLTQGDALG